MGWPPREVAAASLWQFRAAAAGWAEANGGETAEPLTDADFASAEAALDAAPDRTT